MPELSQNEIKAALKDALKEWLNEKFQEVGKWTVHGVLAAGLVAIAYVMLKINGWHLGPR